MKPLTFEKFFLTEKDSRHKFFSNAWFTIFYVP